MGFRVRKSVKLSKGVKINFGKTGVSTTIGSKGLHQTFSSSGRKTTTVGIPGTGLSYSSSTRKGDTNHVDQSSVNDIWKSRSVSDGKSKLIRNGVVSVVFAIILFFVHAFSYNGLPLLLVASIFLSITALIFFIAAKCYSEEDSPDSIMQDATDEETDATSVSDRVSEEPEVGKEYPVEEADEKKSISFKVAGVSFKNDDGKSRQTILREIYWHDTPYDKKAEYTLQEYEYEGDPAIAVYADDEQLGNVPAEMVESLIYRLDEISDVNVTVRGGGKTEDGERLNFGAFVTVSFENSYADV